MKYINKLSVALATAAALSVGAAQAQDNNTDTTKSAPESKVSECAGISARADLLSCLSEYESTVVAPVMAYKDVLPQPLSEAAPTGLGLSCIAMATLEQEMANNIPDLAKDTSPVPLDANIETTRALFSATAGCLHTMASVIEGEGGSGPVVGVRLDDAVLAMRQSAENARALAQALKPR